MLEPLGLQPCASSIWSARPGQKANQGERHYHSTGGKMSQVPHEKASWRTKKAKFEAIEIEKNTTCTGWRRTKNLRRLENTYSKII